ncbi:xanthine dehydrogenase family protein molybdopterin-binding subunit [Burkholderia cenocepacia]|uniref:xanthine dehydrogenase family protein molybdopterin-binding subunit n=1 Tax=Burkholderia cenocepacia TaxID=95486 RepID=UPI0019A04801|nr:molybdopterin cofactor-binding domain-containing protein [Burkholderia cenocepacia]MDN7642123.1 molybdopterin-dependent oxidoreductase [Burkholderia cenocepacia]CAB5115062.1 putative aldehyde oxidase/xanthine dehydrogenase [Burkholderia cenocepacia]CAB5138052.1 putative aldehyde oxidase/xanthine dehydrogenase [Burkholderia cenocepacia]CAB5139730.1 putative aldehyde oxidase/xanthine dehydrogenase [Burkholderia cenocepacia]CAB5141733.1 putative aldehyde oxidase/xanthine dehydrogenase [Burkhol
MNRSELLARTGCLTVIRPPAPPVKPAPGQPGSLSSYVPALPEVFVAILDDGRILAFNGHVDLGTGIRTSLAQIVAEELDVPAARVTMVLGDTAATPNQGPTIASATIQIAATPLRCAAAQARHALLALAAERFGVDTARLDIDDGTISAEGHTITFAALVAARRIALTLDLNARTKDPARYRIVGRASPRVDLPAKATGQLTFVHDMRVPGMLHGRVVRPPYAGHDSGPFVGTSLLDVDRASVADVPGLVAVVVLGDFVGVVAEREEQAIRAARQLRVTWRPLPALPPLDEPAAAIAAAPARRRVLLDEGDVDAARTGPDTLTLSRTYAWPFQMHGSIGPSCALADYRAPGDGRITVWSGTQNPVSLRYDLATLVARDEADVDIVRMEAAGCYGRNGADDVCGDALLLSRAVGRPVRVQLSRADEHLWEPKGAGQSMQVTGTVTRDGRLLGYDFTTRYPSNDAPLLAALLTGAVAPEPRVFEMGDRTAVSPYVSPHRRFVCEDLAPLVRASWLRGVSALPNSFAHDAFVDECAALTGVDPLAFRLRHLQDLRATELLQAVADRAGWMPRAPRPANEREERDASRLVHGRGIAYARYVHSRFPGFGAAWSAWIVDLSVDRVSGEIRIERVTVGQDTGTMINPDGVRHQIHGNVIQVLSRTLKERVRFADGKVASREWASYPILTFAEVPDVDVVLMPRQGEPPLGAGESASVPGPAAVANALFDATGVRFYAPPFTPETVRAALREAGRLMSADAARAPVTAGAT